MHYANKISSYRSLACKGSTNRGINRGNLCKIFKTRSKKILAKKIKSIHTYGSVFGVWWYVRNKNKGNS